MFYVLRSTFYVVCLCLVASQVACSDRPATCQQDAECPSGQRCDNHRCVDVEPTCRTDSDCNGGKICIKNKCQFLVCQDNRDCNQEEECQGGVCKKKPTEMPGSTESSVTEQPSAPDNRDGGAPEQTPEQPDNNQPKICSPNRDGVLDRSELRFEVGTSVIYTQAGSSQNPVTVDLTGKKDADGKVVWDFTTKYPGETRVVDELLDPKGTWYASHYPNATYASILNRTLGLLGVFQVTPQALSLLGSASETANVTRVTYDKPVTLFQFPLKMGQTWTSKVIGTGTFSAAIYRVEETYQFAVDGVGKAKTPQGTFDVLRLRVYLTQQQYLPTLYRRTNYSYYYLSECFGIVATIVSRDYETNALFTSATQVKRLSQ